jgi:hypothetical protein
MTQITAQITIRKDTAANWTSTNPTLEMGEWGMETDTLKRKLGTGVAWNSTPYDELNLESRLISGGVISIGSFGGSGSNNDIRVTASTFFILDEGNFSAAQTDFLDIALSSAGTQRYIGLYGTTSGTITKVEGTEAALASFPTQPADTALVGYVLVGDASIGTTPDLSGYLLKSDKATASDVRTRTNDAIYLTPYSIRFMRWLIAYQNTSSSVTGTTAQTIVANLLIPANTMGANSSLEIKLQATKSGSSGTMTPRVYISPTSNNFGVGVAFSALTAFNSTTRSNSYRLLLVNKNSVSINNMQDITTRFPEIDSTNTLLARNINFAVDQYVIVTIQLANSGDTGVLDNIQVYVE